MRRIANPRRLRAPALFADATPYAALAPAVAAASPPVRDPNVGAPRRSPEPQMARRDAQDASPPAPPPPAAAAAEAAAAENDPAAPDAPPPQTPLDPERKALAGDVAFHAARRRGLLMQGAGLWMALFGGALAALALAPLDAGGLAVTLGLAVLVYGATAAISGLLLDRALERKLVEIRKIARIGCERVRVDDVSMVRQAVRDVMGEWLHIQFFIRRHRETNYWFMWGFAAQSAATALALAALPWSAWVSDPVIRYALLTGALGLALAHGFWEIRRLAAQRRALILEAGGDPAEIIADRMTQLLEEVKTLRKHGRHAD